MINELSTTLSSGLQTHHEQNSHEFNFGMLHFYQKQCMQQILFEINHIFSDNFTGVDKHSEQGVRDIIGGNFQALNELFELNVVIFGPFEVLLHNVLFNLRRCQSARNKTKCSLKSSCCFLFRRLTKIWKSLTRFSLGALKRQQFSRQKTVCIFERIPWACSRRMYNRIQEDLKLCWEKQLLTSPFRHDNLHTLLFNTHLAIICWTFRAKSFGFFTSSSLGV